MRLRNVISPSSHAAQRIGNALLFISIGILVLSLIGAGRLRLNLPHEPMLWPDSFGYLTPGLLKESSGVWSPTVREFLYPEFVYQITRLTGSTGAVVTVQHGLGLASGLVLAWAWVLFIRPLWPRRIFHGLACLLGAAMLEAYWSSPSLLLYECFLMPEVLFLTLSTVEAVVLAWVVGRITTGRIPGGDRKASCRERVSSPV